MLIDDITIETGGGHGGTGKVAFNKNLMSLGPVGGSGGRGGSVYAEGVADIGALRHFRFKKEFYAENGANGNPQFRDGEDGEDMVLKVPVGTVIHNLTTEDSAEVTKIGERIRIAKGGRGGRGNFHFRGPENTSPKEFEHGRPGEHFTVRLELKLIADIGFVGFPNAGKSSLLNVLTRASAKVANYPFTTLEPNLGVYYDLILADIPGLIENASEGKGLGIKFLRHVERTSVFFHFISAESEDVVKDYEVIRGELGKYNPALLDKPEHILLSKADILEEKALNDKLKALKKKCPSVMAISIIDDKRMEDLRKLLGKIVEQKHVQQEEEKTMKARMEKERKEEEEGEE